MMKRRFTSSCDEMDLVLYCTCITSSQPNMKTRALSVNVDRLKGCGHMYSAVLSTSINTALSPKCQFYYYIIPEVNNMISPSFATNSVQPILDTWCHSLSGRLQRKRMFRGLTSGLQNVPTSTCHPRSCSHIALSNASHTSIPRTNTCRNEASA